MPFDLPPNLMAASRAGVDGKRTIERWSDLKSERAPYEADWEDIARLMRPQRGSFSSADAARYRQEVKALSSAPIMAANNFAAGLYGTLTNQANKWCAIQTNDAELNRWGPMARWNDIVTERVLASFRPAVSPFYSAATQLFSDVVSFGNAAQYDEIVLEERKILDITISLAEVVFDIDGFGRICEVVRKFRVKAARAEEMFAGDSLPPKVRELAEKGSQDKVTFYHHVEKNPDYRPRTLGPRGKRWRSVYVCELENWIVRVRGYDEMPFDAPRWEVDTGQIYGIGPGTIALPSSRVLTQMKAANLRAGQKASDPTLLAPDRHAFPLSGSVRPGSVLYGGMSARGQQMVTPLDNFSATGLSMEMENRELEDVRDAFYWTLMNLAGRTGMTATEVLEIQEEKLRNTAPHLGRIQEEYLAPKIARRFGLLLRAGQLPPPPPEAGGRALEVKYTSAAALAQKAAEGAAISRLIGDLAPLAQFDRRYLDRLEPDDVVEAMQEARGAPARILVDRETADQRAQQRAQQEQLMAAAQAAPGLAKAGRDAAEAQAVQEGAA